VSVLLCGALLDWHRESHAYSMCELYLFYWCPYYSENYYSSWFFAVLRESCVL